MEVIITKKIKLTEKEWKLLNDVIDLLDEIYQEGTSQKLDNLINDTIISIADIIKYCETED